MEVFMAVVKIDKNLSITELASLLDHLAKYANCKIEIELFETKIVIKPEDTLEHITKLLNKANIKKPYVVMLYDRFDRDWFTASGEGECSFTNLDEAKKKRDQLNLKDGYFLDGNTYYGVMYFYSKTSGHEMR
jgi:hypothetical protein